MSSCGISALDGFAFLHALIGVFCTLHNQGHLVSCSFWRSSRSATFRSNSALFLNSKMSAQRSPITCHVLDSSVGKPAQGVPVFLYATALSGASAERRLLGESVTNADGRCVNLLDPTSFTAKSEIQDGRTFTIVFQTKGYFEASGRKSFFPFVEITFEIQNASEHHHVPLLLSPYSYTTYRGS